MNEFFHWVLDHWAFCAFILSCIIQITPAIKCSPFTSQARWVGKQITKDVVKKLEVVQGEVKEIKAQQEANEKDRIRFEVLEFANSCRHKRSHTKDEFLHIIDLHDKYERLLKETNDSNGVFTAEYEYILDLYHKCQEENDFLA